MKTLKKMLSAMISLCMITSVCPWTIPQAYAAAFFEGAGTAESPYLISSKEDLVKLSDLINSDDTAAEYNKKYYKQTADIDLGNESFMPIGTYTGNNKGTGFAGVYDGNYCVISGLYIKRVKNGEEKTRNYTGVFGWSYEGKIRNLSVSGNIDSSDSNYVGGIVGELGYKGEITNCSFNGNITGNNKLGGITGSIWQEGKVECCYFNGTISSNNSEAIVGGIVGSATAGYEDAVKNVDISNCYAAGFINADEKSHVGGVLGSIKENNDDSKVNLAANYYLSSMAIGAVDNDNNKNCTKFAEKALKTCADTLGRPFTDNNRTDGFNDGYPVFEWQAEPYRFNGSGTDSDPYVISSKEDFTAMRDMVNSEFFNNKYGSASYILANDIDLENEAWTPIGTFNGNGTGPVFSGVFNGNMHTISNLIVNENEPYAGLFGRIGKYSKAGNVNSLNVLGNVKSTRDCIGGICGEIAYGSSINNCCFIGNVDGLRYVGGVVGKCWYSGSVADCYSNGSVTAQDSAGGIIGATLKAGDERYNVKVENCYYIGDVKANEKAAQIIGVSELNGNKSSTVEIINCYYLKGDEAVNGECTKVDANPTPANLMKHIAEDLGTAFSNNSDTTINDGYPVLAWQTESKTIGDINNDGKIGIADAVVLQRHILGKTPLNSNKFYAADINEDKCVDIFDMVSMRKLLIQQYKDYTEWSTEAPPENAIGVESRIEYRYAKKTYKTSETKLDAPWVLEDTKTEYGDWGKWSDFSETKVEATDNRKVETKTEQRTRLDGYKMFYYCTRANDTKTRWYREYSIADNMGAYGADSGYGEHSSFLYGENMVASEAELNAAPQIAPQEWFRGIANDGINKGNVNGYYLAKDPSHMWYKGDAVYSNYDVTLYRYCDRTQKNIYTYSQAGKYSEWSTIPVTASDETVVETRTVYRYIPSN